MKRTLEERKALTETEQPHENMLRDLLEKVIDDDKQTIPSETNNHSLRCDKGETNGDVQEDISKCQQQFVLSSSNQTNEFNREETNKESSFDRRKFSNNFKKLNCASVFLRWYRKNTKVHANLFTNRVFQMKGMKYKIECISNSATADFNCCAIRLCSEPIAYEKRKIYSDRVNSQSTTDRRQEEEEERLLIESMEMSVILLWFDDYVISIGKHHQIFLDVRELKTLHVHRFSKHAKEQQTFIIATDPLGVIYSTSFTYKKDTKTIDLLWRKSPTLYREEISLAPTLLEQQRHQVTPKLQYIRGSKNFIAALFENGQIAILFGHRWINEGIGCLFETKHQQVGEELFSKFKRQYKTPNTETIEKTCLYTKKSTLQSSEDIRGNLGKRKLQSEPSFRSYPNKLTTPRSGPIKLTPPPLMYFSKPSTNTSPNSSSYGVNLVRKTNEHYYPNQISDVHCKPFYLLHPRKGHTVCVKNMYALCKSLICVIDSGEIVQIGCVLDDVQNEYIHPDYREESYLSLELDERFQESSIKDENLKKKPIAYKNVYVPTNHVLRLQVVKKPLNDEKNDAKELLKFKDQTRTAVAVTSGGGSGSIEKQKAQNATQTPKLFPQRDLSGRTYIKVFSTGKNHVVLLNHRGCVLTYGSNRYRQVMDKEQITYLNEFHHLTYIEEGVVDLSCGKNHTVYVSATLKAYGFGKNTEFQLGQPSCLCVSTPTEFHIKESITRVFGSNNKSYLLGSNGVYYSTSLENNGSLLVV